jgi:histone deacetylase 1/2
MDEAMDDITRENDFLSPDERRPRRLLDARRQADGELSDSDDEGEGGRRNHARHRDNDSNGVSSGNESAGGRKFGVGVGIMTSGQAAATHHGAGPSGYTTVARLLSAANAAHPAMDVDTPATSENGIAPLEPIPAPPLANNAIQIGGHSSS